MEEARFAQLADGLAGAGDVILFEEGLSPTDCAACVTQSSKSAEAAVPAFPGGDGEGYKYAIGLRGGDLRSFVRELNQALDGRGGGRPDFVQGSVRAGRTAIEEFLSAEKQR